jgi:hypothetical protein
MRIPVVVGMVGTAALFAPPAGAPPPLPPFPAVLLPDGLGPVPRVPRLWAFGESAPPLSQIGAAVVVDGAAVATTLEARGCCLVEVVPARPLETGEAVTLLVTTASGELQVDFTVGDIDDLTPPTLDTATLLDDAGGALVIGATGSDDVGLAGFLARAPDTDEIRGAASPDHVLVVDDATCAGEGEGEGEGDGEGEGEGEGEAPAGCFGGAVAPALLLLPLRRRRRR